MTVPPPARVFLHSAWVSAFTHHDQPAARLASGFMEKPGQAAPLALRLRGAGEKPVGRGDPINRPVDSIAVFTTSCGWAARSPWPPPRPWSCSWWGEAENDTREV
jgi:hypothetical protein